MVNQVINVNPPKGFPMKLRIFAALPLIAMVAACATTGAPPPQTDSLSGPASGQDSSEADLEPVYAIGLGRAGVTVRVNSNGCTKKADFKVQVLDGWPAPTVIFKRTRPDMCRAFVAGGTELVFGYPELGLKPSGQIVLANPLTSDPTPGR